MTRQLRRFIAFLAVVATPVLPAQVTTAHLKCTGADAGTFLITPGQPNKNLPPNTAKVTIINANGTASTEILTLPQNNIWTPDQADVDKLASAQIKGAQIVFESSTEPGCTRPFAITGAAPSESGAGGASTTGNSPVVEGRLTERTFNQTDCRLAGGTWEHELESQSGNRGGHFTELVFLESLSGSDANICFYNRDYGVVGDPIHVAVFKQRGTWEAARFEPCAAQAAAPNILQSSEKFPSALQAGAWQLQTFLARRCYNTAVDITIVGRSPDQALVQRYPLTQYDRYRGTVQAGILYSELHDATFALRRDQADTTKSFIYEKGPSNKGPEYLATLNLYAILKYLPSILGRYSPGGTNYYSGRDPIHDQDILDRIGAVLGVGITNPKRRFSAGASFDLIYGVSVIWVADFAQVSVLAPEISTTVPFKGVAADIPTTIVWQRVSSFGLSMDLRYMSTLLTGNRQ